MLDLPADDGGCSVTGGYVVRDPDLESLYGRYLYGDFCAGSCAASPRARAARRATTARSALESRSSSSFGEDSRGTVYATSLDGPVYRLDAAE